MKFPEDFLFGAASAAYQVEGAFDEDGKGLSNWDVFSKIDGKTLNGTNGDVAVDHYHRFKEDIKLMAEMGLESYRFSVSWTRIFPNNDGKVNQKGLDFYNQLIDECLSYGIVPFVTLYHWDLPQYLEEQGGWCSKGTIDAFLRYAEVCFQAFGDRVKHWITFNETIVFTRLGYMTGAHPPGIRQCQEKFFQAIHNVMVSHAKTVLLYKSLKQYGEIGITHVLAPAFPADERESSKKAAVHANYFETAFFYDPVLKGEYPQYCLDILKERQVMFEITEEEQELLRKAVPFNDFMGLNYYQPKRVILIEGESDADLSRVASTGGVGQVSFDGVYQTVKLDDGRYTKWGWEVSPEGFLSGLKQLKENYGDIKLYITENGLGDVDPVIEGEIMDIPRIKYIEEHLAVVKKAIAEGIHLKGYFAWSVIDLLSWLNGYEKQYGFIYVDHENNLERKKKASFYWYQQVIASRGEAL